MNNKIEIYINGACLGSPGKGGYGIVVLMPTGEKCEVSEYIKSTTENQSKLLSAIAALNLLPDLAEEMEIKVYSDSNYLIKGITEWIHEWIENDWSTSHGPIRYKILWLKLQELEQKFNVSWIWLKGETNEHSNLADKLAKEAIKEGKSKTV